MKSLRAAFSLLLVDDTTITIFPYHVKHLADYPVVVVDADLYPDSIGSLLLSAGFFLAIVSPSMLCIPFFPYQKARRRHLIFY